MKKKLIAFILVLSLLLTLATVPGFASQSGQTTLYIESSRKTLLIGESMNLTVYDESFNPVTGALIWESSKPDVMRVDQNGMITAVSLGYSVITVTDSQNNTSSEIFFVDEFYLNAANRISYPGTTVQVVVYSLPGWAASHPLTWSSSNPEVASVDQNGLVTCNSVGSAKITAATQDGDKASINVIVDSRLKITSVDLPSPLVIQLNGFELIGLQTREYTLEDLTVTVDDPSVASAQLTSLLPPSPGFGGIGIYNLWVYAIGPGSTRVTVSGTQGDSVSLEIKVPGLAVKSDIGASLLIGRSSQFYAVASDGTPVDVTWSSDNPDAAVVNEAGLVTAVGYGNARITATDSNGSQAYGSVFALPFEITSTGNTAKLRVGQTTSLALNIVPGWEDRIMITSDDPSVAQANANGQITGLKAGTTWISIRTDMSPSADILCPVTVINNNLFLDQEELRLYRDDTFQLTAQITTSESQTVTWISSNPEVVSVEGGQLTAAAPGTAAITAVSEDGSEDTCIVTVKEPVSSGSFEGYESLRWALDRKTASLTFSGQIPDGCTLYAAVYDKDGRLIGTELLTDTGTITTLFAQHAHTLRLFLLTDIFIPACSGIETYA